LLQNRQKPGASAPADELRRQVFELAMKMEDLSLAMSRLTQGREASPVSAGQPLAAVEAPGAKPDVVAALQRLFEELRDLSLLPDEERQKRWREMQQQRKVIAMQSVTVFAANRQWNEAQKAIVDIEREWPGDPALAGIRSELQSAHAKAEAEAIANAQGEIESEMSLSRWDQALALARKLAVEFPNSESAGELLNRVEREKGIYTETTVGRLHEEIRHCVERRIWRRALLHSKRLLETFPEHPKSEMIRRQIHTIQENAEIEERQEQESRIGELIRARRFGEAVQLSQELLKRFPLSPQAEAIGKLLPRIQELAAEGEGMAERTSAH
jgi:hypothetical protein